MLCLYDVYNLFRVRDLWWDVGWKELQFFFFIHYNLIGFNTITSENLKLIK